MTEGKRVITESRHGSSEQAPDVVLIHPPAISKRYMQTKFMPYGMAVLYSFLKEHHVAVKQYDFLMEYLFNAPEDLNYHDPRRTFSEEDFFSALSGTGSNAVIAEFTEKYGARLVRGARIYAFSIVAYHQYWASLLLASYIRRHNPEAAIVFGGPFITIKPASFFADFGIADYWIKGSGEIPLLELYRLVSGAAGVVRDSIPGIIYQDRDRICQNSQSVVRAEEERMPDFAGLDLDEYRYDHPLTGKRTLFLPYRISKGCPSKCSFCTGRLVDRYDVKSVDKIVSELRKLARRYDTDCFQFADASVNGSPVRLGQLCDRLVRDFPEIRWYSYARVVGFPAELLEKVRSAGCFALFWGVESADQATVDLLGKRFDVKQIFQTIDEAERLGIKNYVHLIYNTPHESDESVKRFIELVERYVDSETIVFMPNRFLLEPQSLMNENPGKYGLRELHKVEASLFEREQLLYEEVEGNDYASVEIRNEEHARKLAFHLHWISFQNLLTRSRNSFMKRIPPRLLARSALYAERSRLWAPLHRSVVAWLNSKTPSLSEQL